jgi:hypothetical protein
LLRRHQFADWAAAHGVRTRLLPPRRYVCWELLQELARGSEMTSTDMFGWRTSYLTEPTSDRAPGPTPKAVAADGGGGERDTLEYELVI